MSKLDTLENVSLAIGLTFGITQIENVLGVIILIFQVFLIVLKYIPKFIEKVKDIINNIQSNNFEEVVDDVNDIKDDTQKLVDELEKFKK